MAKKATAILASNNLTNHQNWGGIFRTLPNYLFMATRKYADHPEVVSHSYRGMVVRFRKVEDAVYIPVTDVRNLLQLGASSIPIFQICYTCAKIEFYKNGKALSAIQSCDLENLAKRGVKAHIYPDQQEKIAWMREICKQIKTEESTPEEALKIFSHPEFGEVRSVPSEDGPLFCLADVCKALELSNPSKVKSRLDESDSQLIDLHALTLSYPQSVGNSKATFINESALYEVILRSDVPKARPFRKWVTKEVLPSIRKTGGYVIAGPDDTPEIVMARGLVAAKEALDRMKQRAITAENNLILAAPKVDYYDAVITDRELYTTTQIASELGMCYKTLRMKLFNAGIITTGVGKLVVTPGHETWGTHEPRTGLRKRTDFKWNKQGRDAIFNLIDPSMPK